MFGYNIYLCICVQNAFCLRKFFLGIAEKYNLFFCGSSLYASFYNHASFTVCKFGLKPQPFPSYHYPTVHKFCKPFSVIRRTCNCSIMCRNCKCVLVLLLLQTLSCSYFHVILSDLLCRQSDIKENEIQQARNWAPFKSHFLTFKIHIYSTTNIKYETHSYEF